MRLGRRESVRDLHFNLFTCSLSYSLQMLMSVTPLIPTRVTVMPPVSTLMVASPAAVCLDSLEMASTVLVSKKIHSSTFGVCCTPLGHFSQRTLPNMHEKIKNLHITYPKVVLAKKALIWVEKNFYTYSDFFLLQILMSVIWEQIIAALMDFVMTLLAVLTVPAVMDTLVMALHVKVCFLNT